MAFKITTIAPVWAGGEELGSTSTTVDASEVSEHLRVLGLNWKQSDQWHGERVILIIELVDLDAEAQVRELQGKLDSIRAAVET